MNYKAHVSVLISYLLLSTALAFVLNYLLFSTDYVVGNGMPLFGTAVFLLPVIWAGPLNSVVVIFIFGYLISTILTLTPLSIGWTRALHWKGLSVLAWAALWVLSGLFGTLLLDNSA